MSLVKQLDQVLPDPWRLGQMGKRDPEFILVLRRNRFFLENQGAGQGAIVEGLGGIPGFTAFGHQHLFFGKLFYQGQYEWLSVGIEQVRSQRPFLGLSDHGLLAPFQRQAGVGC